MEKKTIVNILDFKNNSFNIIGITLAIMVTIFHCYPLFYGVNSPYTDFLSRFMRGNNIGGIAVSMFFIISGFLITSSLKKSNNAILYIYKRVRRIFPALLICLIISAMFMAPILSDIPKGEFLRTPDLYKTYIIDNIFMIKNTVYGIADVFMSNPYPSAINGSIWTLKHQVLLYLIILILYKLGVIKKGKLLIGTFSIITIVFLLLQLGFIDTAILSVKQKLSYFGVFSEFDQFIKLAFYFFSGVMINCYMDEIIVNSKLVVTTIAILLIGNYFGKLNYACMIALPYLTIVIASLKCKFKITDISYEMYILAFPLQQLLMYYMNGKVNITEYIIVSVILTTIFAIILYYLVKVIVSFFEGVFLSR